MENLIRIAVGIIVRHNKVLLVKRLHKEGDLLWQFPGGKLEQGEDPFNTAERETYEETGVKCKATMDLGCRTNPANNVFIYYVLCQYVGGHEYVKDGRENKDVRWVNIDSITTYIPSNLYKGVANYFNLEVS